MIDLFTAYGSNLLPGNGEVNYYGPVLPDADHYLGTCPLLQSAL